jgi:hypothetical protein
VGRRLIGRKFCGNLRSLWVSVALWILLPSKTVESEPAENND